MIEEFDADNTKAGNIKDICMAYDSFFCKRVKSCNKKSICKCLNSEIVYKKEEIKHDKD